MATIQWSLQRSMTCLLLLFAIAPAASRATDDQGQLDELLPSDVPVTMMDRITSNKAQEAKEPIELVTKLGIITGLREETLPPHYNNTHLHAFRGIPFAKSPVGNLRFSDPVDLVGTWSSDPVDLVGTWSSNRLNATKFRSFCPQFDTESSRVLGNEDCLFMNVYTPSHLGESDRANKKLLPVFVFIHGGAFLRGSSSSHGPQKLLSRDVVVVTFNYRLGALGFLSTEDSVVAGNFGMLDQVSALRWVQRNIAEFGGDPQQVTLGGFSAGAAAVHFHMMSPLSENLFHRGIMMSNSAKCMWSLRRDPLRPARLLADKLGCPTTTSSALLSCLSSKTFHQIVTAQAALHRYEFSPIWFSLSVDGGMRSSPFLPALPQDLVTRPTPTIVGSVPNEGLMFSATIILLSKDPSNKTSTFEDAARWIFSPWHYPETETQMKDLAQAFYYDKHCKDNGAAIVEQFTEVLTDYHFTSCVWDAAGDIAETGAPVYTYLMTHRDPETPTWAAPLYDKVRSLGYDSPLLQTGVSHGDDLIYIFAFPYTMGQGSQRDQRVNHILLQMLTNFIVSGEPQENMDRFSLGDLPKWEKVEPNQPVGYYNIAVNPSMVKMPFKVKEQNFWRSVVPRPTSEVPSRTEDVFQESETSTLKQNSHLESSPSLRSNTSSSEGHRVFNDQSLLL